jgi:UDP-N-acetylglucosamine 2-epimerase (non-hydrolysing)
MKVAPLYHTFQKESWVSSCIVHTGQHYDVNMSDAFLRDFALPEPDFYLGVGSGSHAEQTGHVMITYEKLLMQRRHPDLVSGGRRQFHHGCNSNSSETRDSLFDNAS